MLELDVLNPAGHIFLRPWPDPVIDEVGHDPRSEYAERFWLGSLGPSALFLLRHLVDALDRSPSGCDLDLDECARAIGLGGLRGKSAAFPRTLQRLCRFGAARPLDSTTLDVRRKLPPLTRRQAERLPDSLRAEHVRRLENPPAAPLPTPDEARERARGLALSLLATGERPEDVERQLHRWRFHPALAHDATAWATRQKRAATA